MIGSFRTKNNTIILKLFSLVYARFFKVEYLIQFSSSSGKKEIIWRSEPKQ